MKFVIGFIGGGLVVSTAITVAFVTGFISGMAVSDSATPKKTEPVSDTDIS